MHFPLSEPPGRHHQQHVDDRDLSRLALQKRLLALGRRYRHQRGPKVALHVLDKKKKDGKRLSKRSRPCLTAEFRASSWVLLAIKGPNHPFHSQLRAQLYLASSLPRLSRLQSLKIQRNSNRIYIEYISCAMAYQQRHERYHKVRIYILYLANIYIYIYTLYYTFI